MKTLCLFASYVQAEGLPYYSEVYLLELKKQCTNIIYIHTNTLDTKATDFFKVNEIETRLVKNEGFDFGQWKKILLTTHLDEYDELFLINDSCILFSSLNNVVNWFRKNTDDFSGITESLYPERHIQSYFLMFKKQTFELLKKYFSEHNPSSKINEVILDFEIGLSSYLLQHSFKASAFLTNDGYNGEYAPYYYCIESHIKQGTPLIKKKIVFSSYRKDELFTLARMNFKLDVNHYLKLIQNNNFSLIISLDALLKSEKNRMALFSRVKYTITVLLITVYRKLKPNN